MILLASTCISQIFETLVRLCKCAYRFEYNPPRNPSDRYVHDQATVTSIRKSSTRNFLLQSQSFGGGGGGGHPSPVPVGLWAVALASQLRCLKLSQLSFLQDVQGWSHYKLDGDGGTQLKWGCQLYCNIISCSDELISRSYDIISDSDDIISRSDDTLSSFGELISRLDVIICHSDDIISRSDTLISRSDDIITRSNISISRSDDIISRSNKLISRSPKT